ncbi:MAG: rhamnogalacturonan acetylesterase [Phycisphaerae bacterium]
METRPAETQRGAGHAESTATASQLPSIFLAGDSTGANGDPLHIGWGRPFGDYVDAGRARYFNEARGGRSSRTFVTEGLWEKLLGQVKEGDYVLIQFGHNDGGAPDKPPFRGSLPGMGDETMAVHNAKTGQDETVHTFGWYMRKMVEETKKKGATPILLSQTVRNLWHDDGKVVRGMGKYTEWTKQLATEERVAYVDLNGMIADQYDALGRGVVSHFFLVDPVHTDAGGASLNARLAVAGLKALHRQLLDRCFALVAATIDPGPKEDVVVARYSRPGANASAWEKENFLNEVVPANAHLPSIFLIGDSTVRNGRGDGNNGQWGWGDALAAYIDPLKANLVNRALGGTGARTYMAGEWDDTLKLVKPGDVVIMQFGTNDNGPTGPLKGTGEETEERVGRDGKKETVHTYGWYLRKFVSDIRGKHAVPVICTLVPRNVWEGGKIVRPKGSHADWAREVAKDQQVDLIDLYELTAERFDALGQEGTTALYADKRVHTTAAGAEVDAACVVKGLKKLGDDPVGPYFREVVGKSW